MYNPDRASSIFSNNSYNYSPLRSFESMVGTMKSDILEAQYLLRLSNQIAWRT